MKTALKLFLASGLPALLSIVSAHGQSAPKHREYTIWIPPKLGTLIGGGYASSYLTNIRSKTIAREDPELRRAIDSLNDLGMRPVRGFGLVPAAVYWQTNVPIHTLVEQQAQTELSYGELLMVNVLAKQTGLTFNEVVAERVNSQSWGEVAERHGVKTSLLVAKADAAAERIRYVELRYRHKPQQADSGVSYTGTNQHLSVSSRLH
jgi:hypothetical protein